MVLKEHTSLNTDFSAIKKYAPANKSHSIHYQHWQSVDNRVEKVDITATMEDCFDDQILVVSTWSRLSPISKMEEESTGVGCNAEANRLKSSETMTRF